MFRVFTCVFKTCFSVLAKSFLFSQYVLLFFPYYHLEMFKNFSDYLVSFLIQGAGRRKEVSRVPCPTDASV